LTNLQQAVAGGFELLLGQGDGGRVAAIGGGP
jgi:hypothetical protein